MLVLIGGVELSRTDNCFCFRVFLVFIIGRAGLGLDDGDNCCAHTYYLLARLYYILRLVASKAMSCMFALVIESELASVIYDRLTSLTSLLNIYLDYGDTLLLLLSHRRAVQCSYTVFITSSISN